MYKMFLLFNYLNFEAHDSWFHARVIPKPRNTWLRQFESKDNQKQT